MFHNMQPEVVPKSPSGVAVRDAPDQREALTPFLEGDKLEIDIGATQPGSFRHPGQRIASPQLTAGQSCPRSKKPDPTFWIMPGSL
jgi:hypothetical protein